MENKKRILFVAGELSPFIELTDFSVTLNELLILAIEHNYEVRCILPKWSVINERRYRLHEVVRLSGINIRIDKTDYALEIKVTSLPRVRLQVYFLGNEELFGNRNGLYHDQNNKWYPDNGIRKLFFCKSVLQLMRKFGWPPDLIFCSHWVTSFLPMYIIEAYQNEAVLQKARVVYALSAIEFKEKLEKSFLRHASLDNELSPKLLSHYKGLKHIDLQKAAIDYADALAIVDGKVSGELLQRLRDSDKETVDFTEGSDLMEYIKLFEILV